MERGKKAMRSGLTVEQHGPNTRQAKALAFLHDHGELHIRDLAELPPDVNPRILPRDVQNVIPLVVL